MASRDDVFKCRLPCETSVINVEPLTYRVVFINKNNNRKAHFNEREKTTVCYVSKVSLKIRRSLLVRRFVLQELLNWREERFNFMAKLVALRSVRVRRHSKTDYKPNRHCERAN